jgi:lipopolysaccharide/colanic/teichoic acid biosynthesis glycosyltransferase
LNRLEGETTVETATINLQHGRKTPQMKIHIPKYFAAKAWPSRTIGVVLLVLAAPLILVLVAIVRFTSSGRGLYSQSRTGKDGEEFMMYKIRTMYENAESVTGPKWCSKGDSRITPVGKLFRLLHLDELPQLINVVRGEMDLIGPRPERPVFVAWLSREIPNYKERLRVRPGVTGLAQINLPPDETIECVRKKLVLDCEYIQRASLSMDLRILACTFLRMIGIRQGRAARWLQVRYAVDSLENSPILEPFSAPRSPSRADGEHRRPAAPSYAGHGKSTARVAAVESRTIDDSQSVVDDVAVSAVAAPRWPR